MKTTVLIFACVFCLSITALAQTQVSAPSQTAPHFFVAGEVRQPGMFEYREGMSVIRALILAGGLTAKADKSDAIIHRKDQISGKRSPIHVDLAAAMRAEAKSLVLQPEDYLIVPTADHFSVAGEVKQPGQFDYGKGIKVSQAIALAGGLTETAPRSAVVFRQTQLDAKRVEIRVDQIKVDLAAVMKGQEEDVPLLPDDVIVVPKQRQ